MQAARAECEAVAKRYDQYCPIAHALDLVGERWSLLVVRELMHGPLRYTDLLDRLDGCGTNILAARLRALEGCGLVAKRRLPPPAASTVYELTDYGRSLDRVLYELAHWGARTLGPPSPADLGEGWLENALQTAVAPAAPSGRFVFRVEGEIASLVDGVASDGEVADPDVSVTTDAAGFYALVVERRLDAATVEGDRALLERLVDAAGIGPPAPAAFAEGAPLTQTAATTA